MGRGFTRLAVAAVTLGVSSLALGRSWPSPRTARPTGASTTPSRRRPERHRCGRPRPSLEPSLSMLERCDRHQPPYESAPKSMSLSEVSRTRAARVARPPGHHVTGAQSPPELPSTKPHPREQDPTNKVRGARPRASVWVLTSVGAGSFTAADQSPTRRDISEVPAAVVQCLPCSASFQKVRSTRGSKAYSRTVRRRSGRTTTARVQGALSPWTSRVFAASV